MVEGAFFHMCYASVTFQKILNDLEWLSEIFNECNSRMVSACLGLSLTV